jgi:hypothetical protein
VLEEGCARTVAGDNSSALLAAVLQRKQTVVTQNRSVRMTEHAEQPAFMLGERIGLGCGNVDLVWRDHTQ